MEVHGRKDREETGCGPMFVGWRERARPGHRALHPAGHDCAGAREPAEPEPVRVREQQPGAVRGPERLLYSR